MKLIELEIRLYDYLMNRELVLVYLLFLLKKNFYGRFLKDEFYCFLLKVLLKLVLISC